MAFVHQITQISESHCGPAVLAMLMDAQGSIVTQEQVVDASGVGERLEELED